MRKMLLGVLMVGASAMVASATIVDDFTTPTTAICDPNGTGTCTLSNTNTSNAATNTFGGNRRVDILRVGGSGDTTSASLPGASGRLSFASDPGTVGMLTVTWTGSKNITAALETDFRFDFFNNDQGGTVSVNINGGALTWGGNVQDVLGGGLSNGTFIIPLASFTGNQATLSNVTNIVFTFQGNANEDIQFDNVQFGGQVPEPSTLVLLGSALVGLAVYRRRK